MRRYKPLKEQDTFKPPVSVSNEAKRALSYRDKYPDDLKDTGTRVGWERANQLANRENLSMDTVKRMYSFFKRHKGNEKVDSKYKDEPWKDNGYVAWLLWGGDSGFEWVKGIIDKRDK